MKVALVINTELKLLNLAVAKILLDCIQVDLFTRKLYRLRITNLLSQKTGKDGILLKSRQRCAECVSQHFLVLTFLIMKISMDT